MRRFRPWHTVGILLLSATTPAAAQGPPPAPTQTAPTRIIGTHQIDRYEAILQARKVVEADPKNLNEWIILGELAQEVAAETTPDLAPGYYRLARQSYQTAASLAPNNANLKAAAQFALEQEQAAERNAHARKAAAGAYLEARRRELAQSGAAPSVRIYQPPAQGQAPAYSSYYYQPYVTSTGTPYTYQQHSQNASAIGEYGIRIEGQPGQVITQTERGALVKPAAEFAPP